MPIDLPPQPLCLLWREGYIFRGDEDCGCIEGVCGDIGLGSFLLVAGDGPFLFDAIRGHGWGRDGGRGDGGTGGEWRRGLRGI